jgi:hypothetical protein
MNMNRTINILSTSRTTLILLLAPLLTAYRLRPVAMVTVAKE